MGRCVQEYYKALISQNEYPRDVWENTRQKWERSCGLDYTLQERGTKGVDDTSGETLSARHPMCDANDFKTDQWQQTAGEERCGPPVKPYLGRRGHQQDEDGTSALFSVETQSTDPSIQGGSSSSNSKDIRAETVDTSPLVNRIAAELIEVQQGATTRAMVGDSSTGRHHMHWTGSYRKNKEGRLITQDARLEGDANIVQLMKIRQHYNMDTDGPKKFKETSYLEWWKSTDLGKDG